MEKEHDFGVEDETEEIEEQNARRLDVLEDRLLRVEEGLRALRSLEESPRRTVVEPMSVDEAIDFLRGCRYRTKTGDQGRATRHKFSRATRHKFSRAIALLESVRDGGRKAVRTGG